MLYTDTMASGLLKEPVEKTCPECGVSFNTTSPVQSKCSTKCRESYKERRKRERRSQQRKDARPWISCAVCNAKFQHHMPNVKYCSRKCARDAVNQRNQKPRMWVSGQCTECEQWFITEYRINHTRVCSIKCSSRLNNRKRSTVPSIRECLECGATIVHTFAKGKARLLCSRECYKKRNHRIKVRTPDEKKLNNHRRRARHYGVPYEPIKLADVADRDGWICGICKNPVDPWLTWPDGQSKSLDHIIPMSKGGEHVRSNVQVAHLDCNTRKSNSIPMPL